MPTAAQIWKTLSNMYSRRGNVMVMMEIQNKADGVKQAGRSVEQYASELQYLWGELDHYAPLHMRDPQDAQDVQKWVEDRRVTHFLRNLDPEFESRRAAFCHQDSLPTMEEAVSAMVIEESRLRMMSGNNPVKSAYTTVAVKKCYNCGEEGHLSYNCPLPKSYVGRSGTRGGRGDAHGDQGGRGGRGGGRIGGRGRGRGRAGPQVNAATSEEIPSLTLTGEQVKQWEQWQKIKASETSSTPVGPVITTTSHFGNFANYAHLGKGIQAQALASTYRHNIEWVIDSGASKHVTGIFSSFRTYTPHSYSETIQTADGTSQPIHGVGSIDCTPSLHLASVLHVPSFPVNLLSVSSLIDQFKCIVTFDENFCTFQEKRTGRVIGTGVRRNGLWFINQEESALTAATEAQEREIYLLHYRLGHVPFGNLNKLYPDVFKGVDIKKLVCDACELGKHTRTTYPSIGLRSCEPFMLIHSDVWGPCSVTSVSGFKWFVTFIDCYTRMTWIYMLKGKHEVLRCFQDFHKLVANQFNARIRIIQTDNGKEYVNNEFEAYLSDHGIIHQTTCPNTPPQNGVAERKNRHLLEVARSMMFQMNVPKYLWSEAVLTAAYLINRMPSRILNMRSPTELLLGQREFKVSPKVFGCVCFVRDHRPSVGKLDPQAVKCVFVGYSSTQKGYKCWDPVAKKLFVSMDVTFREFEPYYTKSWDLDPFLEEFSSVTEGDSREGENDEGVVAQKEVIVGDIPCPMDVSETPKAVDQDNVVDMGNGGHAVDQDNVVDMGNGGHENDEIIGDGNEEAIDEGSEGGIAKEPIVYQRRRFRNQGEQIVVKEPIVYQRRRLRSQGEQVDAPQLQQPASPVPNLSTDLSPSSSSTQSGSSGNASSSPDHVELPLAQRRDTRSNFGKPPVRYGFEHPSTDYDIANFISYSRLSPAFRAFVTSLQTVPIPKDWKCAKQDPKWNAAMKEEMHALQKNKTWELVPLPKGKKAVGCKWVFTVKQNPKGEVDRYKARLVAKGYSQTYGIDYDETFAPVAKMGTVRTLISCAVNFGWPLHQMDVKNAFLHGDLQEEVYMEIPPGFANSQTVGKVCRLKKSLYGLKQSPRTWFDRFKRAVCDMGYCHGHKEGRRRAQVS